MRSAELIALVYVLYLTCVGLARGPRRATLGCVVALAAVVGNTIVWGQAPVTAWARLARDAWPLLLLLVGYRLSGAFYVRPHLGIEAWLRHVDVVAARAAARSMAVPRLFAGPWLELAYFAAYPIIPLGAIAYARSSPDGSVDRFWAMVLTAGFVCYGVLPWIQTRPPRDLEGPADRPASVLRRLNLAILDRGSVQVNTLPSGHAATAVATALAVVPQDPRIGGLLLAAAGCIALATVTRRYHYLVDTVLGVLVGAGVAVAATWWPR